MLYDRRFYDAIRPGVQSSAAVVVPLLVERYEPQHVIDVGCGEGWWGYEFTKHGCTVTGVDGSHIVGHCEVPMVAADLAKVGSLTPFAASGPFDMAVCLEVAEHLPPERAESFVDELCALAPVVVFSAAIPGQTGAGHVNCQWQTWWAAKFQDRCRLTSRDISRATWTDDAVEPWYRQNLFVAVVDGITTGKSWFDYSPVIDVVHPRIWEWKL